MTGVGLVGAGNWGGNWLRTLATLPEASLRWCCDLNPSLLQEISAKHPTVRTTSQMDDLLGDPETVGIVIASIVPTHYALAKRALEAGKHVMVEKPMALTSKEAVELTQIAQSTDRVLMVGHLMEYHSAIPALRKVIEEGELGDIRRIESRRSNHGIIRHEENAWWSLAPHDISMVIRLMGAWPLSVQCEGQCLVQPQVEDVVGATLRFSGDRMARIDVSWHDPSKVRELKVYGTQKWAVFNDMLPWERKVVVFDQGFDVDPAAPPRSRITARRQGEEAVVLDRSEPLVVEAQHFLKCIANGERPLSDGASGTAVVSVLEAGQQSLATGREVSVPRPPSGFGLRIAG